MAAALEHGHTRHGGRKLTSPTYNTWISLRRRCDQESCDSYPDYGGRGITYDDRWEDFALFLEDMGVRPEGTTLDRIDSDGDYTKANCRWATPKQQLLNRRNTPRLTHGGLTLSLYEWAERVSIPYQTIWSRVFKRRWPHSKALTAPVITHHRRKA